MHDSSDVSFDNGPSDDSEDIEERVPSPCNRVCTLDDADICLGCGRTLAEIKAWGGAGNDLRRKIVATAQARSEAREEAARQRTGLRWRR